MNTAQMKTPFRTTTPFAPATTAATAKQVDPVHVHKKSGPPAHCAHVYKAGLQTMGIISLWKSQALTQWKDICEQTSIDKARHSVTIFHLL